MSDSQVAEAVAEIFRETQAAAGGSDKTQRHRSSQVTPTTSDRVTMATGSDRVTKATTTSSVE